MTLQEAQNAIRPLNTAAMVEAKKRLDSIIKPLNSLGKLEEHLVKISGITGSADMDLSKKAVVVFCADNGVVAQGVSQSGQEVTAIVAENLTTGDTCVCHMAKVAGADVVPIDIGIATQVEVPGLLDRKIAWGTKDFTMEPAMTGEQAVTALEVGIHLALDLKKQGYRMLATGEMGIGNTTTSAAIISALLGLPPGKTAGRGAGLSSQGLARKTEAISQALALHTPNPEDPLDVLAKVGGLDIAGMAGLCLGAGVCGVPVVLDGVISGAAAMLACRLHPLVGQYLLPSHVSAEPAGALVLEDLGLSPLLHARMRLGEGTGAVATFPLYDMMLEIYNTMVVFSDEGMEAYQPME